MKSIYGVFSFLLVIVGALNCKAEVAGEWRLHPSADMFAYGSGGYNNCMKINDGERFVYIQQLTAYHDNRTYPYSEENTSVFRFDKLNPESGFIPVVAESKDSGMDVAFIEYSPEGGYEVVAHKSGLIDIFHDNGDVVRSKGVTLFNAPGSREINYVTPDIDGSKFYVATGFGYIIVDATSGDVIDIVNIVCNTKGVSRVGDKMVLIANNSLYSMNCGQSVRSIKDLEKLLIDSDINQPNYINDDRSIRDPNGIYPLNDDTFIYTAQYKNSEAMGPVINVVGRTSGGWAMIYPAIDVTSYTYWGLNPNWAYKDKNTGLILPSRSGYVYIGGAQNFYVINKDYKINFSSSNITDDFKTRGYRLIPKIGFGTTMANSRETAARSGSFDEENFWFFYPREGFKTRSVTVDGSTASWTVPSEAISPNAPEAYRAQSFEWHPRYGLLVRNHGADKRFDSNSGQPDGLSSYKDGEWEYRGLAKTNYDQRNRVPNPRGVSIDPMDDRYVWGTSKEQGILRLNLDDPTDVLVMSKEVSGTYPYYVAIHPRQSEWPNLSCFARIKFDRDNTMWTAYTDWQLYGTSETAAKLWYWTEDDRRASINCNKDASLYKPMGEIVVPTSSMLYTGEVYPMNLDVNKNLVGWTPGHYYEAFVLDHNGTLSDTSDDKIAYIVDIFDKTNTKLDLHHPVYMFEDPYDGAILVSYSAGVLVTSREQLFQQKKRGEWLQVENDPAGIVGRPIAQGEVTGIAVDALGRKWIATVDDGLYCLSEDRKTLLGHYTASTSMLPTDMCLGIAYNPDTNSIFIGTDAGIAEFIPAGSVSSSRDKSVTVVPAVVEPHFKGHVTVSGLTDGIKYSVIAPSGLLYGEPMESSNGRIQVEFSANTHFSGEYSIVDTDGNIAVTFIVLK